MITLAPKPEGKTSCAHLCGESETLCSRCYHYLLSEAELAGARARERAYKEHRQREDRELRERMRKRRTHSPAVIAMMAASICLKPISSC